MAKIGQHAPEDIGIAYLFRTKDEMDYAAGINGNLEQVGATALDLVITNLNTNQLGLPATPKEVLVKGYWQSGHTLRQITGT